MEPKKDSQAHHNLSDSTSRGLFSAGSETKSKGIPLKPEKKRPETRDDEEEEEGEAYIEASKYVEAEAKVDLLVEKAKSLERMNARAAEELGKVQSKSAHLRKLYEELNKEAQNLEEVNNAKEAENRYNIPLEINWDRRMELLNKKQSEERERLKRELVNGALLLDVNKDFQVLSTKEENIFTKLYNVTAGILDWIVPLGSDISFLKAKYDHTISGFFVFFRFLVGFSILTAVLFSGLLIYHVSTYEGTFGSLTDDFYPTFTLYSSFSTKYATAYSGTIQAFIVLAIICTLSRWIHFFKENTTHNLYDDKSVKYSKLLFNWWDWTMKDKAECNNLNETNCIEFKLMLYEETVKRVVESRPTSEMFSLFVRRIVLIILNTVIVAGGWVAIATVYFYEKDIIEYTEQFSVLQFMASFIPGLVLAAINFVFPEISLWITRLESWDFASTRMKNEVWKQFLTTISNIVIVCVISLEFMFRKAYFQDNSIMSPLSVYPCREDQIATTFFKLTISDFIIPIVILEIIHWLRYLLGMKKLTFVVSAEAVAILYFQGLVFCTILFYPYFALVVPIIYYLRFKYIEYMLRVHRDVTVESSSSPDTGGFLMIFYVLTLLVSTVYYSVTFQSSSSHVSSRGDQCGPFTSAKAPADEAFDYLESFSVLEYVVYAVMYAPLLWLVTFMLASDVLYTNGINERMAEHGKLLQAEQKRQIETLNKRILMLDKQIALYKTGGQNNE